jgi:hypothetical protein
VSVSAYPLQWPTGRPRTSPSARQYGRFNKKQHNGRWNETKSLSVADALGRLQDELDRIGARYPVISTNLEPRLDGLPRSGQPEPVDPGVALYFDLKGEPHCLPCDTYTRVADNIAAIAKHIEATRAIERYGVASIREMFAGFAALPPPGGAESQLWWKVLGVEPTASEDQIQAAYRKRAVEFHPDRPGGSAAAMAELNAARDAALRAVRGMA